ncbi:MAG: tetratricopeptide repeat protein [Acidobacteriota bacterium]|nr:MAG: tetratricopeptide repeat protein [Acidobacteriota bacterium]
MQKVIYAIGQTASGAIHQYRVAALLILFAFAVGWTATTAAAQDDDVAEAIELFEMGQDRHSKGELREAEEFYRKAIEKLPEFPEALYQLGTLQQAKGDIRNAEANFRQAVELRPDWTLAMTSLASLLVSDGKIAEARTLITEALEIDPQNPPAIATLAEILIRSKAPKSELEKILVRTVDLSEKANPTAAIWCARAALERALGKTNEARKSAARSAEIDKGFRSAYYLLIEIGIEQSDAELAKDAFAKLRSTGISDDRILLLNARIAAAEGRLDDAENLLKQLNERTSEAESLAKKIRVLKSTSASLLEKELESEPDDVDILAALCNAYRVTDAAKAIVFCQRGMEAAPARNDLRIGLGAALVQAKQYEPAVSVLRESAAAEPKNYTARANLATALFKLKRHDEALAEFRKLADERPTSPIAYYFLGIIHDEMTEYADAAANYNLFLKYADRGQNAEEILQAEIRLPQLAKLVKEGKGKRRN